MLTAAECQAQANKCKRLAQNPGTSEHRAALLRNIARSLAGLANQLDRLTAITRDEARGQPASADRPIARTN
ncbi:hypothetical protein AS156_40125 [Bradyrhizobium macuxiense]|uniref:Uncharacterized protein n=1 Tax=Bradyrhizobium macuxiense TaxID=1755647 RepID=A0A109JY48_9BRAD|nr:hypothetical protein AS156_40125 [Bradyrhizobium macuxiense]